MRRWRRGVGTVAILAATIVAGAHAAATAPPGSDASSAPEGDGHDELVEGIVTSYGGEDVPLDRDCVSAAVADVPAGDIETLLAILAGEDVATVSGTQAAAPPTTAELTTDVDVLGRAILLCVDGDADPQLVEQVVTILDESDEVPDLDLECARRMLSIVPDDVLELVIADPLGTGPLASADIEVTAPLFMLLACSESDPFAEPPESTA